MNARILTLLPQGPGVLDVGMLLPERLQGKDASTIGRMPMTPDARVADYFAVSGVDSGHLVLRGPAARLDNVGHGMRSGRITVEGDCGNHAGFEMRGGTIRVAGDVGDFAACEMRAGLIEVSGKAGDFAGGALAGNMQGMRGGYLVVHGNAGHRAGDRMRRGLILVAGDVGDYCGSRMLAGTILAGGRSGAMPGLALRRGTLLLNRAQADLPAYFHDSGVHRLLFLRLLERQLQKLGGTFDRFAPLPAVVRRYCGDLGAGGTGEILVPA